MAMHTIVIIVVSVYHCVFIDCICQVLFVSFLPLLRL